MEMMYLVFWLNNGMAVMPEKYPIEQCEAIAKNFDGLAKRVICIPTPKTNCRRFRTNNDGTVTFVDDFCYPITGK